MTSKEEEVVIEQQTHLPNVSYEELNRILAERNSLKVQLAERDKQIELLVDLVNQMCSSMKSFQGNLDRTITSSKEGLLNAIGVLPGRRSMVYVNEEEEINDIDTFSDLHLEGSTSKAWLNSFNMDGASESAQVDLGPILVATDKGSLNGNNNVRPARNRPIKRPEIGLGIRIRNRSRRMPGDAEDIKEMETEYQVIKKPKVWAPATRITVIMAVILYGLAITEYVLGKYLGST